MARLARRAPRDVVDAAAGGRPRDRRGGVGLGERPRQRDRRPRRGTRGDRAGSGRPSRPGDLTDAFALASALAARDSDSTVVVVTDAAGDDLPELGSRSPGAGRARRRPSTRNQAIAALSAACGAPAARSSTCSWPSPTRRAPTRLAGSRSTPTASWSTRGISPFPPGSAPRRWSATVPSAPSTSRPASPGPMRSTPTTAPSPSCRAEETDPRAARGREGSAFLENALALLPRLELYAVGEAGYVDAVDRWRRRRDAVRVHRLRRRRAG